MLFFLLSLAAVPRLPMRWSPANLQCTESRVRTSLRLYCLRCEERSLSLKFSSTMASLVERMSSMPKRLD